MNNYILLEKRWLLNMSILKLKDSQGNWISVPTLKGDKGNGIQSAVLNNDYTLTLTFTDGTTYTTPSIRGEKGEKGEPATDMDIHICSSNEYDSETRIPTIANPDDKTFYLVPTEDGTSPDLFTEWVYVNNAWEMFGSMKIDLSGYLTDVQINGTSIVQNKVANIDLTGIEQNTERIASLEEDRYKPYVVDTASGSIASFPDGADDIPLKSLVVDINPVQDLHGYDSPWVGGGGKNLIDSRLSAVQAVNTNGTWSGNVYTLNGLTFTVADDGHITINGTSTANTYFTVYRNSEGITLSTGSYVLHKSGSADIIVAAPKNGSYWTSATTNDSVVSLTESARVSYYVQIQNGKTISNYNLYPMIEAGTTATSWTPYENICPISGWTQINAYNDPLHGGNIEWNQVCDNDFLKHYQKSGGASIAKSGNSYTITYGTTNALFYLASDYRKLYATSGQKIFVMVKNYNTANKGTSTVRFSFETSLTTGNTIDETLPVSGAAIYTARSNVYGFGMYAIQNQDGNKISFDAISVFNLTQMFGAGNEPSTVEEFRALFPNDYYPYNEGEKTTVSAVNEKPYTHVNIQLGQTVYGGHLNVISGVLTVDRAMVDLGTLNWSYYVGDSFAMFLSSAINDLKRSIEWRGICSIYGISRVSVQNVADKMISNGYADGRIRVKDSRFTDVNSFVADVTGQTLVYELAEPIEIQLSANQLNSLYGANNLWADSGDTEVVYRADTKAYIAKKIAEAISALS